MTDLTQRIDEWFASRDFDWLRHFHDESDRGCVLIAQGVLEERLGDVIAAHILGDPKVTKKLVSKLRGGRNNPIGSFAASIDYAEKEGIFSRRKWMAAGLRRINKMRVAFAHYAPPYVMAITPAHIHSLLEGSNPKDKKFPKVIVRQRIKRIVDDLKDEPYSHERKQFLAIAWVLMIYLEAKLQPIPFHS